MAIKAYVTTSDTDEIDNLIIEDQEVLETLVPKENEIAVQMQELFSAVSESISESLVTESQLTIEVSGAIKLKATGGAKFLVFNLSGGTSNENAMKVTLSTTLKPK
ncbi:MAG: hypothetical protein GY737_16435 [Desulfobacteraceae bacterium]|nr:hypothetical protein [Desulfobacteraceae bacterium]